MTKQTEWAVELRPKSFDQMVGQETNREILTNWVATNTLPNALIFFGKSGSGKTTCGRILPLVMDAELVELDAASNNSVEDARNINNLANRLSLSGKHKVFLIDEAHMLSAAAWNALLKSIEEPDPKTHFVFCSTDYTKIPLTIRGRSRMLKFYSVLPSLLLEYAQAVLEYKGYKLPDDVLDIVVKQANGQVRDLLKVLQTAAEGNLNTADKLKRFLAIPDAKGMRTFINAVLSGQPKLGVKVIKDVETDLLEWVQALQQHIYQLLEDKFNITPLNFGTDAAQQSKVRELESKFTDKQWGALLTELNKITRNETAYAQLYALLFAGI